jgi:membrane protease YdiL (CAAX protease family)
VTPPPGTPSQPAPRSSTSSGNPRAVDRRLEHAALFLLAALPLVALPRSWLVWPAPLLVPLGLYGIVVAAAPRLRSSVSWLAAGKVTPTLLAAASAAVLVAFHRSSEPDLEHLRRYIPLLSIAGGVAGGAIFSVTNAALEEAVFRGILYGAFEARWNAPVAVAGTALLFALGHAGGYPPGAIGVVLAGIFGLGLGIIRAVTGGLALPVLVHVAADATIVSLMCTSV